MDGTRILCAKLGAIHTSFYDNGAGIVVIGDVDAASNSYCLWVDNVAEQLKFGTFPGTPSVLFALSAAGKIATYAGVAVSGIPVEVVRYLTSSTKSANFTITGTPYTPGLTSQVYRILVNVYVASVFRRRNGCGDSRLYG